jgi:hypothetical protein
MSDEVKHPAVRSDLDPHGDMTPAEFRALGLLQEVNRLYLHPLGYAMGVRFRSEIPEAGDPGEFFVAITDDEEGFVFEPFTPEEVERGHQLAERYRSQTAKREYNLQLPNGIQPLHGEATA